MRVVPPPVAAGQSHYLSSSLQSASVEDMDEDNEDVDDGGGGLWQRGRWDPVVVDIVVIVIIVVVVDNDNEGYGPVAVFLVLVLISIIISGVSIVIGIVGIAALSHCCRRCRFAAASALASVIPAAVVVAANAAAAANHQWLVVVSPTPSSAAQSVIRRFRHCAIVNTFAAISHPPSLTFASRCPIHHLHYSHRWLVVAFSTCTAAYQLNHQAENVFMFPHLDLFC
jgi:hypothetical protein